jgi:hypothetical protein
MTPPEGLPCKLRRQSRRSDVGNVKILLSIEAGIEAPRESPVRRPVVSLSQTLVTNLIYLDRTDARGVGIAR